jgi:hypothetical protein
MDSTGLRAIFTQAASRLVITLRAIRRPSGKEPQVTSTTRYSPPVFIRSLLGAEREARIAFVFSQLGLE